MPAYVPRRLLDLAERASDGVVNGLGGLLLAQDLDGYTQTRGLGTGHDSGHLCIYIYI